jgi:hypothetical protein
VKQPEELIMRFRIALVTVLLALVAGAAHADTITFSGYFNDAGNGALRWSDLGPPLFADDWEVANNVAIYEVNLPFGGNATFDSNGFAAGGADPYFTLFSGLGAAATFLYSNYDQAFSTGGDFLYVLPLMAGDYTVAMGVFANMSFADNYGAGALGDGFVGLGEPYLLGNYYYELGVTRPDEPVPPIPEPGTLLLIGSGLAGCFARRKKT